MKQQSFNLTNDVLPDRLESKGVIVGKSGTVAIVQRVSKRDDFGEPCYRLRYVRYMALSERRWTRDELQNEGCVYIYRKDVEESKAVELGRCEL
jgi:hypothetical protein